MGWSEPASLYRKHDLASRIAFALVKIETTINAAVGSLLFVDRSRSDKTKCPPLELIRVFACQHRCVLRRHRFADHLIRKWVRTCDEQPMPDQVHCKMRDVDPRPPPAECFGHRDR